MVPKTIIIAEAGVNHNGSIRRAKQLIDVAVDTGADYVKFQTFKTDKLVSRDAKQAAYQKQHSVEDDDSQYEMLKKLELSEEQHLELYNYALEKNIGFLSTPFDVESLLFLDKLGIQILKIASGEITNYPLLEQVAHLGKPIVMSTGMAELKEVEDALDVLLKNGADKKNITILHCNTEYPTPYEDVNLLAMQTMRRTLGVDVGYSDHTMGIEVPTAAVALGAKIIEKHFTLDRNSHGPDHKASLDPASLKKMVKAIRNVEVALGNSVKKPSVSELKNIHVARKSIHLDRSVKKGEKLSHDDLIMLRPGDGISPMLVNEVLGKRVLYDLERGHKITWEDIK